MASFKICMLGDFAVGKTSLVRQFVDQAFSEKYLTTVGVKIDTKSVETTAGPAKMVLWDIAGAADLGVLQANYIRGMAGYLLVCDGTRAPTLNSAKSIQQAVAQGHPKLPFFLLVNKSDLTDAEEIDDAKLAELQDRGWNVLRTSARTGENVEAAFQQLAQRLIDEHHGTQQ